MTPKEISEQMSNIDEILGKVLDEDTEYDSGVNKDTEAYDPVEYVKHYQFIGDYEVRHIIQRAIELNGLSGCEAHYYSNALKYLLRCGRKGKKHEDLKKASQYLGFLDELQD